MKLVLLFAVLLAITLATSIKQDGAGVDDYGYGPEPSSYGGYGDAYSFEGYSEWEQDYENGLRNELDDIKEKLQEVKFQLADGEAFQHKFNEAFRAVDTDNSGFIDEAEIQQALTKAAHEEGMPAPAPGDTYGLLQWFDINEDGVLQKKEVEVMFRYLLTNGIWDLASTIGWIEVELGEHQFPPLPETEDDAWARLDELYIEQNHEYNYIWTIENELANPQALRNQLNEAWAMNDWDQSGDLDFDETYQFVVQICDHFDLSVPSEEDFQMGFHFLDADQSGTIDGQELKVAINLFLIPAVVDTFAQKVREVVYLNSEIDEIYWSGVFDEEWDVQGEEDPYWDGYNHGWEDGYAVAYFDITGEWPENNYGDYDMYDGEWSGSSSWEDSTEEYVEAPVLSQIKKSKTLSFIQKSRSQSKEVTVEKNTKQGGCSGPPPCKESKQGKQGGCSGPPPCKESKQGKQGGCSGPPPCLVQKGSKQGGCSGPPPCKESKQGKQGGCSGPPPCLVQKGSKQGGCSGPPPCKGSKSLKSGNPFRNGGKKQSLQQRRRRQ